MEWRRVAHAIIVNMNSKINKPFPLIIAHRGASAVAPENTLAAFKLAHQAGADGIELDVMLSKDNQLVIMHDDTVDRTTNGSGRVRDMTYAELKELDVGSHFSADFVGEKIPLLTQVYELLGKKLLINVELKNYATPFDDLTAKVIELTEKFNLVDSIILSSFNPINLSKARRINRNIRLGLLTAPGKPGKILRSRVGRIFPYDALHPHYSDTNSNLVQYIHQINRHVNVWTVDDPDELLRLKALGIDAVICNDPKSARAFLSGS